MWIVTKALHTLYRIAVVQTRRTIPDRIGLLFRHENSDFGAISVTKRGCGTAPISKVERHISDRFCVTLWCIVNSYSGRSGSEYRDLKIRGRNKLPRLPEANLHHEACAHEVQTRVLAVLVSSRTPFSLSVMASSRETWVFLGLFWPIIRRNRFPFQICWPWCFLRSYSSRFLLEIFLNEEKKP